MTGTLKISKLMLLLGSISMAGAIHSVAQAQEVDCNSGLTQIAIASEQGSETGLSPSLERCVRGAQQNLPRQEEFVGTGQRETRAASEGAWKHAWPDQSYVQD